MEQGSRSRSKQLNMKRSNGSSVDLSNVSTSSIITNMDSENDQLKLQLTPNILSSQETTQGLQRNYQSLVDTCITQNNMLTQLRLEFDSLQKTLLQQGALKDTLLQDQKQLEQQSSEKSKQQEYIHELQESREKLRSQIQALNMQQSLSIFSRDDSIAKLQTSQNECFELQKKLDLAKSGNDVELFQAKIFELQNLVTAKAAELEEQKTSLISTSKQLSNHKEHLQKSANMHYRQNEDNSNLQDETSRLNARIEKQNLKLRTLAEEAESCRYKLANVVDSNTTLKNQLSMQRKEYDKCRSSLNKALEHGGGGQSFHGGLGEFEDVPEESVSTPSVFVPSDVIQSNILPDDAAKLIRELRLTNTQQQDQQDSVWKEREEYLKKSKLLSEAAKLAKKELTSALGKERQQTIVMSELTEQVVQLTQAMARNMTDKDQLLYDLRNVQEQLQTVMEDKIALEEQKDTLVVENKEQTSQLQNNELIKEKLLQQEEKMKTEMQNKYTTELKRMETSVEQQKQVNLLLDHDNVKYEQLVKKQRTELEKLQADLLKMKINLVNAEDERDALKKQNIILEEKNTRQLQLQSSLNPADETIQTLQKQLGSANAQISKLQTELAETKIALDVLGK